MPSANQLPDVGLGVVLGLRPVTVALALALLNQASQHHNSLCFVLPDQLPELVHGTLGWPLRPNVRVMSDAKV